MARTKTEGEKSHLPATLSDAKIQEGGPPSFLVPVNQEPDEVAGTFGEMTKDQPRQAFHTIPLATIQHKTGNFNVAGVTQDFVEGYPLYGYQVRGWWKDAYKSGAHTPPSCWAPDAGPAARPSPQASEPQAKSCAECRHSKFGSAKVGGGQACRVTTIQFVANPAFGEIPIVALCLPPTSIRPLMGGGRTPGYLQAAKNFVDPETKKKAKYHELVWTRFNLVPGGDLHHVITPESVGVCRSADEARALATLRGTFLEAMERLRGDVATVTPDGGEGD